MKPKLRLAPLKPPTDVLKFAYKRSEHQRNDIPRLHFITSVDRADKLPIYLQHCLKFLDYFARIPQMKPFLFPVIGYPNYQRIVKHPIDMQTIRAKIFKQGYETLSDFKTDIDLIWSNCYLFNPPDSEVVEMAKQMQLLFDQCWDIHLKITDTEGAKTFIEDITLGLKHSTQADILGRTTFQPYRYPEFEEPEDDGDSFKKPKGRRVEIQASEMRLPYIPPTAELLEKPMSTSEKYEIGAILDNLPLELLGNVVHILRRDVEIDGKSDVEIKMDDLSNKTLRHLQAWVDESGSNEKIVRRMHHKETMKAGELIVKLEALVEQIRSAMGDQMTPDSEGFTTEGESLTEGGESSEDEEAADETNKT